MKWTRGKLNNLFLCPSLLKLLSVYGGPLSLMTILLVSVRYPHEKHGLAGKVSNSAKVSTKESFLKFVDNNSQANGRRLDSRNPTHYFFPKFKTISEAKRNASAYNEKAMSSLVYEFNRTQREASLDTISSQTALNWLKAERPKTAIYPHQSDYCDYCSKIKVEIQGCTQSISRHLQSDSSSTEDIEKLKKKKEDLQNDVEEHRKIAREVLQYYRQMKERCNKQWCEIVELESSSSSPERDQKLPLCY